MKKAFFFASFFIFTQITSANSDRDYISGSWINNKVIQYYEINNVQPCNSYFYDNIDFIPLSLSFKNKNQLDITFRYEQKVFTYNLKPSNTNVIVIYRGNRVLKLIKSDDGLLKLEYNKHIICFTQVADSYSKDVFSEFLKSKIFKVFDNYTVSLFNENKDFNNIKIGRNNFEIILKNLFKCDNLNIVTLGLFEYKNQCLPEIAIYYKEQNILPNPRKLGIVRDGDLIKFVDASGLCILMIKGIK